MRQRAIFPIVCFVTYALSIVICLTVARGDEPPVRVEHLGYSYGGAHRAVLFYEFQITIVNKHDRPTWFLFPYGAGNPPPKNGVFKNDDNVSALRVPFEGKRYNGKGGSVVLVTFYSHDEFKAFHVPAKGHVVLKGLEILDSKVSYAGKFSTLMVLEARDLRVNGRTPLEKWLPYDTMSSANVSSADVSASSGFFGLLDWDKKNHRRRDDYPKEQVKFVQAEKFQAWTVEFHPRGKIPD